MNNTKTAWFENWFDSPYYHILYKDRDDKEAEEFISNLINFLKPPATSKILDLACGAGRHSIFINKMGYDVAGVDLSENSINTAKAHKKDNLHFDTHDMREVYKQKEFNYIFSMFTSFGYFENKADNVKMLQSVNAGLAQNGTFLLDFFNAKTVIKNLVPNEEKTEQGITFKLTRELVDGYIRKSIKFNASEESYSYFEKVEALTLSDLEVIFNEANLKIVHTFGSYQLDEFDENISDRLIIIAEKA
jgi:SAM-dependent methyltransferase